ncbi:MAG: exopolysaccharide biosynthesis polyprenyl glycosylphosphotransferase [Chlorobi bacterium]|nr:exopolysaccharide biosynthesis polyprenyl glycosylphosphotransferase [Chlorobiota bacterium]NOG66987.1 exopolysaccharide biosynthesis polyprenyl glycosylphosphotransferase [Chlorobiota bacterium]
MHIPTLLELGEDVKATARGIERAPDLRAGRLATTVLLIANDAFVITAVLWLALMIRSFSIPTSIPFSGYALIGAALVLGNTLASAWRGNYPGYGTCAIAELRNTFYTITGVFALVIAVSFFSRDWPPYVRSILLGSYLVSVPTLAMARMALRRWLGRFDWYGIPVLIVGVNSMAKRTVDVLRNHRQLGLRPMVIVEPDSETAEYGYHEGVPVIGGLETIEPICTTYRIKHGIVTMPHKRIEKARSIIDEYCQHLDHITVIGENVNPSVIWISNTTADAQAIGDVEQRLRYPALRLKKRLFDIAMVIPLLMLALPIMLVVSVLVLVLNGRPILFRQERIGEKGKKFTILKFRTMHNNAEARLAAILAEDSRAREEYKRYHKLKEDPRVTRLGRILRKYSLDELPQLFNVIRADMSLVGTRPLAEREFGDLSADTMKLVANLQEYTKPGLSGLWQISVRADGPFEERPHIDHYYMRNWSLFLDLYIVIRTAAAVLGGRGAY